MVSKFVNGDPKPMQYKRSRIVAACERDISALRRIILPMK